MWRRRSRHIDFNPEDLDRARAADACAAADLARVRALWPEVDRVANDAHELLSRNHFGESIELAFERRRA
ncbi:hypothetical protein [Nocardia sp. NBC_00511]|uniref:DUF7620 family protein n=1 Tax=Nocardia sp. NBC_00511 TaxID=2903591 RepID=UPI0030DFCF6D